MSLIKIVPAGSWNFGMEPTAIIKVARTGLGGIDRSDFFQKRAASHAFADLLEKMPFLPGELPIHTIAIGSTEGYGANRNGDGFCEATCRKQASTFVSRSLRDYIAGQHNGARLFMNHVNDDPYNSFGYVKAAVYNEQMRRIELLIAGNATKEAAERNGGHVMSDDWINDLYAGKFMAGSMACKVAYDVCSICGNRAPSRKEYCTKEACIGSDGVHGFGCKEGLTRFLKSGRQQFVENPGSTFFDWSKVVRPAERTAYGGIARDFMKAASYDDEVVLGGAWLAEHYGLGGGLAMGGMLWDSPATEFQRKQVKLAHALADVEADVHAGNNNRDKVSCLAFSEVVQTPINFRDALGEAGTTKFASGMKALADHEVMLTPKDFFAGAIPADVPAVYAALPNVFRKLAADPDLPRLVAAQSNSDARPTDAQKSFAKMAAETRSVCPCSLEKRAQLAVIRGRHYSQLCIKSASEYGPPDHDAARRYALYQLSALASMPGQSESPLTLRTVVLQNTGIA